MPSAAQTSASQYQVNMHSAATTRSVAVRRDDLEERLRRRRHVAVHEHLAGRVEDADVHGLHVQIDSAVVRDAGRL